MFVVAIRIATSFISKVAENPNKEAFVQSDERSRIFNESWTSTKFGYCYPSRYKIVEGHFIGLCLLLSTSEQ